MYYYTSCLVLLVLGAVSPASGGLINPLKTCRLECGGRMAHLGMGWDEGPKHCQWCTCYNTKLSCVKLCRTKGVCPLGYGDVCQSAEVDRPNDCPENLACQAKPGEEEKRCLYYNPCYSTECGEGETCQVVSTEEGGHRAECMRGCVTSCGNPEPHTMSYHHVLDEGPGICQKCHCKNGTRHCVAVEDCTRDPATEPCPCGVVGKECRQDGATCVKQDPGCTDCTGKCLPLPPAP